MDRKRILSGLIALCAVCIFPAATYSQSPQIGITAGRARALVAVAVALISLVIGGLALARPAGRIGNGRARSIAALVLGLIGFVIGALVAATANGGLGTGSGLGGALVAMIMGLIGMALGGLALARLHMPSRSDDAATSSIKERR